MKILVTGGCGFIGSHLVDALVEEHEVTVLDNLSTGRRENLNPKAKFIEKSIGEPWSNLGKYELVYHLAALPRIQPSIKNPLASNQVNLTGTLKVLEYCRKNKAKLVFSGSSSVFKGDVLPTGELAEKHPKNPYSLQKWLCEQYIELYHELYGLDYATLRYFNVYGDRQLTEGAYATVIGIFLKQKVEGKPLTITNDGSQSRDFTHVKDIVKANLMAKDWTGTFNIGSGMNYTINEIADMIGGETEYIGNREGEVRTTLCDNSKAREKGWYPEHSLKEYLNAFSNNS